LGDEPTRCHVNMNLPDEVTLRNIINRACRAPSVQDTQPWRWVAAGRTLELFADTRLQLICADHTGRDMVVSCGAALHHLEVAAAAAGWATVVRRFPDPDNANHLANVSFTEVPPRRSRSGVDGPSSRR
jgi:nitroreductase